MKSLMGDIGKALMDSGIGPLIGSILTGLMTDLVVNPLTEAWNKVNEFITGMIVAPLTEAWDNFVGFWAGIHDGITGTIQEAWNSLVMWGEAVSSGVSGVLFNAWNIWILFWAAIQSGSALLTTTWGQITKFFAIVASDVTGWVGDRWEALTKFFASVSSDVTGWVKNRWDSITSFFQGIFDAMKSIWDRVLSILRKLGAKGPSLGSGVSANASGGYSHPKYHATGGIISEPVIGMGLNSGQRYSFGESGPEQVTPIGTGGKSSGGSGISITIHVGTIQNKSDMDAMIAQMMQALQKEQFRRGIT